MSRVTMLRDWVVVLDRLVDKVVQKLFFSTIQVVLSSIARELESLVLSMM